jgi:hypothetical protein
MDKYIQQADLPLFGIHVKTFPLGIKESFDVLMDKFGDKHSYYGLSWMGEDGSIQYYAAVSAPTNNGTAHDDYDNMIIAKGAYRTRTILNWMSQTDSIKDVFHDLLDGGCPDRQRPCIEWYKSDEEMLCMVSIG